jgi:hypothetical protein
MSKDDKLIVCLNHGATMTQRASVFLCALRGSSSLIKPHKLIRKPETEFV